MRALTLCLALATGVPAAATGQSNCLEQIKFPEVGRWAEYKALYNKKDPYTVRYAVIGTEQRNGQLMQWVELRMTGENKDRNIVYQMLVPGSLMEMGEVQDIVFKAGDRPAMKMNGMMMKMIPGPFSLIKSVGENHKMELTAQGGGAKSSITEKPQEMPGMGGPS